MPRRRLGVVLIVPGVAAAAVNGLRRAVGTDVRRIDPHITLVPPVNVRSDDLSAALQVLRTAAGHVRPFELTIGPAASFEPVSPVLYLRVDGALAEVVALRERVFSAPLSRPLRLPFHPHVTLGENLAADRTAAAVTAMGSFEMTIALDRLHLLEEQRLDDGRRVWRTIADAPLQPSAVVGRGSLPLEIRVTGHADPEALALLDQSVTSPGGRPLTVTGSTDGQVVGAAFGSTGGGWARLDAVVVADGRRRQGIGRHLLASFERAAAAADGATVVAGFPEGDPVSALCRSAGWVETARVTGASNEVLVLIERRLR